MERLVFMTDQKTSMVNALGARMARRLAAREPTALDPARSFAIKRSVHELEIEAGAGAFARALHEVVSEPGASFGLIRLKRPADRLGRPFAPGERFHGCFSIALKLRGRLLGRIL